MTKPLTISDLNHNSVIVPPLPLESALASFNVVHQTVQDLMATDAFLFASRHENEACDRLIGNAITCLADQASVAEVRVYVEGIAQTGELTAQRAYLMQEMAIAHSVADKIRFFSWDLKGEPGRQLFATDKRLSLQTDQLQKTLADTSELYSQVVSKIEGYLEVSDTLTATQAQELATLVAQQSMLIEFQEAAAQSLKEVTALFKETIATTFPLRTLSMVTALRETPPSTLQNRILSVFVAGTDHLQQQDEAGEQFNLDLFYQELANHRSAILIPKTL